MSSSRLPKKVLKKILGKPMLFYVVKQVLNSKLIDQVIIATTNEEKDNPIIDFCKKYNLIYFRGSKLDLLDRYYQCAKKFHCDPVVRITSDCPLIDPIVIDKVVTKFLKNSYDYVSNNLDKINGKWDNSTCNFPQGMTVEISNFKTLKKAWKKAKKPSEREHVFPYVQFNPKLFRISNVKKRKDVSYIRCTVDRLEDLRFVRELYDRLPKKEFIMIEDILKIVKKEPSLVKINNKISFDEGYKKSLLVDKKQDF